MPDFLSLPAELRLKVYHYLIPSDQILIFSPAHVTRSSGYAIPPSYNLLPKSLAIATNLFLVSRHVYREVANVLYHENTFRFHIHHAPARIHGCCLYVQHYEPRLAMSFPMLNPSAATRIKKMDLEIDGSLQDFRIYQHIKAWLSAIVHVLTERENHLAQLKVTLMDNEYIYGRSWQLRWSRAKPVKEQNVLHANGQYCLEPLAKLRGIKSVVIDGNFEGDFGAKLIGVVQSEDTKELPLAAYNGSVVFRRRKGRQRRLRQIVSQKKWWNPTYEWDEGAKAVQEDEIFQNGEL
jgi:hypothetical protein